MSGSVCYTRVLLKLSGNALGGEEGVGFGESQLRYIAGEIAEIVHQGCALGVVVGAGNILRGAAFSRTAGARLSADNAGMVATVVNGLVLRQELEDSGIPAYLCSALPVEGIAERFRSDSCQSQLKTGRVVILAGGTGNPFFTTDTAAALRAVQLEMDIVLKATRVDGVFSSDPESDGPSEFLPCLSYEDVLTGRLGIMDFGAVDLCRQHGIPFRVFNFKVRGNLKRAVMGEPIGTFIGNQ